MAVTPLPTVKGPLPASSSGDRKALAGGLDSVASRVQAIIRNRGGTNLGGAARIAEDVLRGGRTLDDVRATFDRVAKDQGWKAPKATSVKTLDLDEIKAALKAVSSGFDVNRRSILADKERTRQVAHRALQRLGIGRDDALGQLRSNAAGSGLLRSGLAVKDTGRIADTFAQSRSEIVSERDATLRNLASSLATLRTQEASARAAKARELARAQVGTSEAIARALKLV